ncbi:hypothetical protein EJB05_29303, partial [Eragrostis curvula]
MSDDGVRRVVRPQRRYMTSGKEQSEARSRLLSRMDAFYTEASDRLLVAARSVDAAGICVGLLDPVSNITANAICTSDEKVAGAVVDEKRQEELGRRSLEGLVAFLLYFFPYMAHWEALRYLHLADADLLAAARLIVTDRGMTARFCVTSSAAAPAFEEALTIAADIAKHPEPKQLAHVWMQLSSRLHQVLALLQPPDQNLDTLKTLLEEPAVPDLATPWDIAASRQRHHSDNIITNNISYQHTRSLRMVLLDAIHGYYLKALAILPRGELRSRLHRSLLRAGNCYGPLDPVSNIIINTLWYDANFPAAESVTPVLDVIGPNSLTRLVSRSFYGLVSFLQTRYHDLPEHRIVQCLVAASGWLSIADPKLLTSGAGASEAGEQQHYQHCLKSMSGLYDDAIRKMEKGSPCSDVEEAYAAAATAAWHPNPEEQAKFLASWEEGAFPRHPITAGDVQHWSSVLSEKAKPQPPERIRNPCYPARAGRARSMNLQRRISKKVKDALDRHLLHDGKPAFDLHIICCVNENVCGPEFCADVDPLAFAPCKYRYSHVNFLATERGPTSDSNVITANPVLFFAEFDNEDEDGAPLFLCQVHEPTPFAEHVRCLYCEAEGVKVVHPPSLKFHGGGTELEEVIRGKHEHLSGGFLICKNEYAVQMLYAVEEDFMYVDVW